MAFASDSTTAPARPLLPPDRRAIGRDGWARARQIAARLGGEIRDHVAEGMRQAWAAARGLLQPGQPEKSRLPDQIGTSDVVPSHLGHSGVVPSLLPLPAPLPSLTAAVSRRRAIFGAVAVDEPDTALAALTLYLRRQIEAAAEHGADLLAALGLPRLVGPDFRCVDIDTAGDALDHAIATLDAMDGDADLEDGHDDEHDTADLEDDETGDDLLDLGEFDEAEREPIWNNAHTTDVPAVGYFNG